MTELAERIALALLEAERRRRATIAGSEILEVDGLVALLSGLPDASLNGTLVAREPTDPRVALARIESEVRSRGLTFSIHLQADRHLGLDRAVRDAGMARWLDGPAMAVVTDSLPALAPPANVELRDATPRDLPAIAALDADAFGTDPDVSKRFINSGWLDMADSRLVQAVIDGEPVGEASAILVSDLVGVFGVAVAEGARRRGIGAALTVHMARAFGDEADIAFLLPTPQARALYGRLGFRPVARWEVWGRALT